MVDRLPEIVNSKDKDMFFFKVCLAGAEGGMDRRVTNHCRVLQR